MLRGLILFVSMSKGTLLLILSLIASILEPCRSKRMRIDGDFSIEWANTAQVNRASEAAAALASLSSLDLNKDGFTQKDSEEHGFSTAIQALIPDIMSYSGFPMASAIFCTAQKVLRLLLGGLKNAKKKDSKMDWEYLEEAANNLKFIYAKFEEVSKNSAYLLEDPPRCPDYVNHILFDNERRLMDFQIDGSHIFKDDIKWRKTHGAIEGAVLWSVLELKILNSLKHCAKIRSKPDFIQYIDKVRFPEVKDLIHKLNSFLKVYSEHRDYWNSHDSWDSRPDWEYKCIGHEGGGSCKTIYHHPRNCGLTPSGTWSGFEAWWNPPPTCPQIPCKPCNSVIVRQGHTSTHRIEYDLGQRKITKCNIRLRKCKVDYMHNWNTSKKALTTLVRWAVGKESLE